MGDIEYAQKVFAMMRAASDDTENWQQALDLLLDAAGFLASENNVPPFQAMERLTEAHAVYTDAPSHRVI